jgi:predicted AlkP superfamily phosphohydrolase/phosphomutase
VPKDFLRKQIKKHGEHPVRSCHNYTAEADSIKRMCSALIEGIEQRTRMYMELLSGDDWDFYYAAISEGHCASHLMWHLCDDGHPAFSDVLAQELRQPLLRVYRAIDRGIGELRRVAGENCSFVIYLTHGIGANYSAVSVFPDILREFNANWAGDRKGKKNSAEASSSSTLDKIWQATVGKLPVAVRGDLKRYIPINLRAWITQKRKENVARKRSSLSHSVAQDGFSAVRVNLLGREPAGLILAGSEYTEYVDALVAELSSLVNIDTGEPVLGQVFRADTHLDPLELTGGNDLTIWWSKAAPIRAVKSATLGRFDTETKEKRTGEHIMHGALIINDSRFEAGNRNITGMSVIDVAPTICELAGVEPGEPLPGKSRIAEFKASASGTNLG